MPAERITITVAPDVAAEIRRHAAEAEMSVSRWMGEAAEKSLRRYRLKRLVAEWDAEDGPASQAEMAEARALFGIQASARVP